MLSHRFRLYDLGQEDTARGETPGGAVLTFWRGRGGRGLCRWTASKCAEADFELQESALSRTPAPESRRSLLADESANEFQRRAPMESQQLWGCGGSCLPQLPPTDLFPPGPHYLQNSLSSYSPMKKKLYNRASHCHEQEFTPRIINNQDSATLPPLPIPNIIILANRHNFAELVYQEGYDVLVFLYTTEVVNVGQRNVALQVNLVADAFIKLMEAFPQQQLGVSVRIVAYDVNVNAFPEGIDFTLDLPQILFFPAYNKRPPFRKYQGQAAIAGPILQFIEKYADVQFKFPVDISKVGYPRNDTIAANNTTAVEGQAEEKQAISEEREDL